MESDAQRSLFMHLVTQHQGQLFGYLYALVQNLDDAQDLQQQTLMVLWRKFDSFEPNTNFLAWAYRIAQIEVFNFRKRRPRHFGLSDEVLSEIAASYFSDAALADPGGYGDALAGCLERLTAADRQLVEDCYERSCRINQIAQQLGRSEGSVSNSLRRIRRRLYDCIQRKLTTEGLA